MVLIKGRHIQYYFSRIFFFIFLWRVFFSQDGFRILRFDGWLLNQLLLVLAQTYGFIPFMWIFGQFFMKLGNRLVKSGEIVTNVAKI